MSSEPNVSTKDRPGDYDAIETAKPGEPLFPVQGGDPFGPATVLFWADLVRTAARAHDDQKEGLRLLRKAMQAEEVAWAMQSYQRGEQALPGVSARYNDQVEATLHESSQRATLIQCASMLHNAIAVANEVVVLLGGIQAQPEQEVLIREAIETLRAAALEIEPRRAGERT